MSKHTESSRMSSRVANLRDARQHKFLVPRGNGGRKGGGTRSTFVRKLAAQRKAGTKVRSEWTFLVSVMQYKAGN